MSIPRFLYHGTGGQYHDVIMTNGLQPRSQTGQSNWHGRYQSSEHHVYLTDTYPLFFATQALDKEGYHCVLYEIDTTLLNRSLLCADEDVLALWMRAEAQKLAGKNIDPKFTLDLVIADARKNMHMVSAERSLEAMGTCAYQGNIPLHAIRRALFITADKTAELILRGMDPVVNLSNFQFCGAEYKEAVQWLFQQTAQQGILRGVQYDERFRMWLNPVYSEGITV